MKNPTMASDLHQNWKEVDGDNTYALAWDIGRGDLVWEIGGYEGRWAAQMSEKYDTRIDIFEPQPWAVERLQTRFKENKRVSIYPYGLWVMDAALPLYNFETDGASILAEGARSQVCQFKDVYGELDGEVDVCLMNVEGSEFVLIPYLIGNDLMRNFKYFWCQFHLFVPNSKRRMLTIYEQMERTHRVMWDYFPTAVAWERK
jgi:FkbM family methyltransferase